MDYFYEFFERTQFRFENQPRSRIFIVPVAKWAQSSSRISDQIQFSGRQNSVTVELDQGQFQWTSLFHKYSKYVNKLMGHENPYLGKSAQPS